MSVFKALLLIFIFVASFLVTLLGINYAEEKYQRRIEIGKALETSIEFQERFIGTGHKRFAEIISIIDQRKKIPQEIQKEIKGIANHSQRGVFLVLNENFYIHITSFEEFKKWI